MRAISISSLFQAVGRPELHPRRVGVGEHFGAAVLADIFGVVADQAVALAGDSVLHLAGGGELEALLDAALGLELGHFVSSSTFVNRHGSPFGRAVRQYFPELESRRLYGEPRRKARGRRPRCAASRRNAATARGIQLKHSR